MVTPRILFTRLYALLVAGAAFIGVLQTLRAAEPQVVVVFGDSITEGSALPAAEKSQAWVNRVETQAGGQFKLVNEGKGGRPTDSVAEFDAMLKRRPKADVLIIALGTNDSRDISAQCVPKAVANIRMMVERGRKAYGANVAVLIMGPPNIRKNALGPASRPIADQREAKLRELGAAFSVLAQQLHCQFLSLYGVVPEAALSRDGVHPSGEGNAPIAEAVLANLKEKPKPGH